MMRARVVGMMAILLGLIVGVSWVIAEESPVSTDQPAAVSAPASTTTASAASTQGQAATGETVWLDDALPPNAKTEGVWLWDTTTVNSGKKSHGHPSGKGLQSHSFTADPISLAADGMIVQQVWLDPQDPPKGILMKFTLANGEEVGVYWEGEQEVFSPGDEEELWYYGLLPELGKWTSLEILAEDLGLEGEQIKGIRFATFDGRVLWDKTAITKAPSAAAVESIPSEIPLTPPAPAGTEEKKG